jgi:hypothetical protein
MALVHSSSQSNRHLNDQNSPSKLLRLIQLQIREIAEEENLNFNFNSVFVIRNEEDSKTPMKDFYFLTDVDDSVEPKKEAFIDLKKILLILATILNRSDIPAEQNGTVLNIAETFTLTFLQKTTQKASQSVLFKHFCAYETDGSLHLISFPKSNWKIAQTDAYTLITCPIAAQFSMLDPKQNYAKLKSSNLE